MRDYVKCDIPQAAMSRGLNPHKSFDYGFNYLERETD